MRDTSLEVPHGSGGRVIGVNRFSRAAGDELAPGVNELVRIYVAQKRKVQQLSLIHICSGRARAGRVRS